MTFAELLAREPAQPFERGGKIPWQRPDFSARMLHEHLAQHHDRASRRLATIERQVAWLHESVLAGGAGRVLDLGCGPGLYTARLARRGHRCTGIDFSPAAVAYAQGEAEREHLACEYRLEDLRCARLDTGYDAVLLIFGELDTFPTDEARAIRASARTALAAGGALVLEVHEEAFVRALGEAAPTWFTAARSVFADEPHLCLRECAWHAAARAATERYFTIPLSGKEVVRCTSTTKAHSEREYRDLLREAGFADVRRHASLAGDDAPAEPGLFVWVARG